MKKELKDYLHLYLGCEVMTNQGKGMLIAVFNQDDGVVSELVLLSDGGDPDSIEWVKPILRHLSDITDEELKNLRSERGPLKGVHRDDLRFVRNVNQWSPEDFVFLLSKNFDLFGLIENGFALCAPKLEAVHSSL